MSVRGVRGGVMNVIEEWECEPDTERLRRCVGVREGGGECVEGGRIYIGQIMTRINCEIYSQ